MSPSHTVRLLAGLMGKVPERVRCVPPSVEPLDGLTEDSSGVRLVSKVKVVPAKVCSMAPCKGSTETNKCFDGCSCGTS
jgi:hypothetical protein